MSGFSPEWLALREPFDAAARDRELARRFADALPPRARIADLGGGTGANVRFLEPFIGGEHRWRTIDSDPALLAQAAKLTAALPVETERYDLTNDLGPILGACDAVATSALLDLVSAAWLDRLAAGLAQRQLPFLAALSVDGRIEFDPPAPDDAVVVDAFARHQRGDKGFGSALGAAAAGHLAARLDSLGYAVTLASSDWRIECSDIAMMRTYLDDLIAAAREAVPAERDRIGTWAALRRRQTSARELVVRVGHRDLLALCPRRRA